MRPRRLEPRFVERVWGCEDLSPYFAETGRKIGEVWFQPADDFPLLVKLLFTSEPLSVQVHPGDEYARRHENARGKCEMWHILAAEDGAKVAIGFREEITEEQLRSAVADGSISDLLNWMDVRPGDTYYTQAGVVHAIGAGIKLCEIQQNSDVTYRLHDFGRGREVHIEKAVAVADRGAYDGRRPFPVSCEHFHTEVVHWTAPAREEAQGDHFLVLVDGSAKLDGLAVQAGEVWFIPESAGELVIEPAPALRALRARPTGRSYQARHQ